MKVVCLIDSLGSGGAQRQLCTLAVGLKKLGFDVSVLTYHPHDFFLPLLREAQISWTCLQTRSPAEHVFSVRRALRRGDQDVVLSFLDAPNLYAELAALPHRAWGLVVSERLARPGGHRGRHRWLRQLHRVADVVTTNSHTNRLLIERTSRTVGSRVVTVYNAVDFEHFKYASPRTGDCRELRIVVASSYQGKKNPVRFVQALALARRRVSGVEFRLDWYGGFNRKRDGSIDRDVFDAARDCIVSTGMQNFVRLHEASPAIVESYRSADVVALPSLFEGLPNTICEGMATGRPILMSNVCDAGNLVKEGENGFLFDPTCVEDMARAIVKMAMLSKVQREQFGLLSRKMAERMFSSEVVAQYYAEILSSAGQMKRKEIRHWTPEVPKSAYQSAW
jgi:glycosyltransferase involved in cell wall biosynthesis